MRKTKIICTMGPATDKEGVLEELVATGMDVARCNFSHGDYEEHGKRMDRIKAARKKYNRPVAILLDTKGPEIRLENFKNGEEILEAGQEFTLFHDSCEGTADGISITYKELYLDVVPGGHILLDDGLIALKVTEVKGKDIVCKVINGGKISNHKGVNVPDVSLSLPFLSEKDKQDILFGIRQDVDFVAASFVRRADDVKKMRKFLNDHGGYSIDIVAKIENREGVNNIDEILEFAEGIMIARGDMGVEIPYEEVPVIQKQLIKKVAETGKQVITATQMLDSMMKNPRPTRAETTDVANAIYDGTGAIMLSGETAAGAYPVEALHTMMKIAEYTEQDIDYRKRFYTKERKSDPNVTDAICHATCTTAYDLNAKAVVTVTMSGSSARNVARYRPGCMILAGTVNEKVARQLNLCWGVSPLTIEMQNDVFDLYDHALEVAKEDGYLQIGDITVITSGVPIGVKGTTNMLKVQVVE